MLFVKLLFLFAGGGVLTGVSVSNAYKGNPQTPVANNKTAKKLAKQELKLKATLLSYDKNRSVAAEKRAVASLATKTEALTTAKAELIKANDDLNKEKKSLNETSAKLKKKYEELETKNTALSDALKAHMAEELTEKEKELNKAFYEAQKATYEEEKKSIQAKIDTLTATSSGTKSTVVANICENNGTTWSLTTSIDKTSEEVAIEDAIKAELKIVCTALTGLDTEISKHSYTKDDTKSATYEAAKTARNGVVTEIRDLTNQYNKTRISISSKESDANRKILLWTQKQAAHKTAKEKSENTKNQLASVEEQINEQNNVLKNF